MTDRELLERAARAAGYGDGHYEDGSWLEVRYGYTAALYLAHDDVDGYWNPLEHDGQALRLAVKLQLTIANEHINAGATYCTRPKPGAGIDEDTFPEVQSGTNESELIPEDYAATRRAIVLAAAALA
jgi:hypothetical protein